MRGHFSLKMVSSRIILVRAFRTSCEDNLAERDVENYVRVKKGENFKIKVNFEFLSRHCAVLRLVFVGKIRSVRIFLQADRNLSYGSMSDTVCVLFLPVLFDSKALFFVCVRLRFRSTLSIWHAQRTIGVFNKLISAQEDASHEDNRRHK